MSVLVGMFPSRSFLDLSMLRSEPYDSLVAE